MPQSPGAQPPSMMAGQAPDLRSPGVGGGLPGMPPLSVGGPGLPPFLQGGPSMPQQHLPPGSSPASGGSTGGAGLPSESASSGMSELQKLVNMQPQVMPPVVSRSQQPPTPASISEMARLVAATAPGQRSPSQKPPDGLYDSHEIKQEFMKKGMLSTSKLPY